MPYKGEFAQYKPLRRLVESERINQLLGNYRVQDIVSATQTPLTIIERKYLEQDGWLPDWALAIDGSHAEVAVKNGYPGAEASYITVASVLIDLAKTRSLDQHRPIDPKIFRTLEQAESIDCALPGCNVIYQDEASAKSSLRRALFDVLSSTALATDGESLLDTYETLLQFKPQFREQGCPYDDCPIAGRYLPQKNRYVCDCEERRLLYSSDALRIHERMNPAGSNGAIFAEVMQVLERIWFIHVLRVFEAKGLLSVLKRVAVILDGPLAVYGQPAWLSGAIYKELLRLNEVIRKATGGRDLLLVGIEKTGLFVDHFDFIDTNEDGTKGKFPNDAVALLDDTYIKQNIVFSESDRPYGEATYFGRKFFFKTGSGAKVVGSLPFLTEEAKNVSRADESQYSRLADALTTLNYLISSRYANAVTPLVSAHAEASIPLNLGKKILERIAREIIGEGK